ncbi:hypothetical protein FQA39_LY07283 [Lamprigera yunnana]|nr:hypothetical protein FQA39_LY07283 [Lamprigera yunnana]
MDVDLLRPGTVPISPDTVLWFEFLLDEHLLLKHLEKLKPDPSPLELINKFISVVHEGTNSTKRVELDNGDFKDTISENQTTWSLKHLALKILSLRVIAFLKWNLDIIKELPFKYQLNLLQDLLYFTNNQIAVDIYNIPEIEDPEILTQPYGFALILYHRWIVRTSISYSYNGSLKYFGNVEFTSLDDSLIRSPQNIQKSICFLIDVLTKYRAPTFLTFNCFTMPKEDTENIEHNWNNSLPIVNEEFFCQIAYDLAEFYFFKENYEAASSYFNNCLQYYKSIEHHIGYLTITLKKLDGYLLACSVSTEKSYSLLLQLQNSVINQYMGILNILQKDNVLREIPLLYRINLELDIQGALRSGKFTVARDLLPKIQSLNAVRSILDKSCIYHYDFDITTFDTFMWALSSALENGNAQDKGLLKNFLLQFILENNDTDTSNLLPGPIFDLIKDDIKKIDALRKRNVSPPLVKSQKDSLEGFVNPRLEARHLEQEIIACYNANELRQLVAKALTKSTCRSIWKINPCWELPIPLQSVLVSLPKGYLQDFSFVLLAKSKELMLGKNWILSLELLNVLKNEVKPETGNVIPKLDRLLSWEILLVRINQLLEEWPAINVDKKELANECEACLQTAESVLPRAEIMEHCALCLLNLGHFEFLSVFEKRWNYFEITATIAAACQDLIKYKGSKKLPRELWDLVLPVFGSVPQQLKRNNTGGSSLIQRDSPVSNTKNTKSMLVSFFLRLRDSTVLTIVISMLARLHNVLRDESTLELNVDYIMVWPAVVSNSNSYNSKAVLEVLMKILHKTLQYYPFNVSWLRLMGDTNFVNGHYEEALNYYLKSLVISSDNFNLPIRHDEQVIRRMIKSCGILNCYTQAAVLCQFLEEPDYVLAFHNLAEQKLATDALDSYYHCFWNNSILEFLVNFHHKRSEFRRRKHVVQVMGLLELNSSNNEEIQHEASNLRKNVFLRALYKLYVH